MYRGRTRKRSKLPRPSARAMWFRSARGTLTANIDPAPARRLLLGYLRGRVVLWPCNIERKPKANQRKSTENQRTWTLERRRQVLSQRGYRKGIAGEAEAEELCLSQRRARANPQVPQKLRRIPLDLNKDSYEKAIGFPYDNYKVPIRQRQDPMRDHLMTCERHTHEKVGPLNMCKGVPSRHQLDSARVLRNILEYQGIF